MKKALIILGLGIVISFSACSSKQNVDAVVEQKEEQESNKNEEQASRTQTEVDTAVVVPVVDIGFYEIQPILDAISNVYGRKWDELTTDYMIEKYHLEGQQQYEYIMDDEGVYVQTESDEKPTIYLSPDEGVYDEETGITRHFKVVTNSSITELNEDKSNWIRTIEQKDMYLIYSERVSNEYDGRNDNLGKIFSNISDNTFVEYIKALGFSDYKSWNFEYPHQYVLPVNTEYGKYIARVIVDVNDNDNITWFDLHPEDFNTKNYMEINLEGKNGRFWLEVRTRGDSKLKLGETDNIEEDDSEYVTYNISPFFVPMTVDSSNIIEQRKDDKFINEIRDKFILIDTQDNIDIYLDDENMIYYLLDNEKQLATSVPVPIEDEESEDFDSDKTISIDQNDPLIGKYKEEDGYYKVEIRKNNNDKYELALSWGSGYEGEYVTELTQKSETSYEGFIDETQESIDVYVKDAFNLELGYDYEMHYMKRVK